MARRKTAFRADYAGITLGTPPDSLAFLRGPPIFIPWADVEQVILYPSGLSEPDAPARIQYIAVQRREEAAPPAPDGAIPAPGHATPAAHKITGWRLDRERFAALAAAMAPGVPIVEASAGSAGARQAGPPDPQRAETRSGPGGSSFSTQTGRPSDCSTMPWSRRSRLAAGYPERSGWQSSRRQQRHGRAARRGRRHAGRPASPDTVGDRNARVQAPDGMQLTLFTPE
jgi:hypothetical protein